MKTENLFLAGAVAIILSSCSQQKQFPAIHMTYPETKKEIVTEDYFGTNVNDPYRWLEDDLSEETGQWVEAQNKVTFNYLQQIPFRDSVRARLNDLANYVRYGIPFKRGEKVYYFKNSGLQNQSVLYVINEQGEEELFLDPNTFSEDGTTSIGEIEFSPDGTMMAYTTSEGGSDWRTIFVMNAETKELIGKPVENTKFSSIQWLKNDGFFYSSYDKPTAGSELSGMTDQHKVYYHKLNTRQSDDIVIFGKNEKRRYVGVSTFKKSNILLLTAAEGTSGNELYIKNNALSKMNFMPIIDNFENDHDVVHAQGNEFYLLTNLDAPNKRLVKVLQEKPYPKEWIDIIPEKDEVIESITFAGGNIFAGYIKDASSKNYQYSLNGELIREIELPGIGTTDGFDGEDKDTDIFYAYQSFNIPYSIYSFNITSGKTELYRKPEMEADIDNLVVNQVFYTSKDGTKIPMFIVHKKDIALDGQNPTLLYGYGGFNISLTPYYSTRWISWLDMGGVFALANLRGGGEYGEEWHKAGMQYNKQNVFDDFIAAAEYLQHNKYCTSEKLSIMGGSNGGLLVGACMLQRPDLFGVALPAVGVLDMLRYHKFTAGAGWIPDYGCADSSKAMFDYLYAYSPVHNVIEGTAYPATLITTADHDDRVVPAHSFKFAAHLQDKHRGDAPVLIRIDTKAGHGAGKSISMFLDEVADSYSFAFYNMNTTPQNISK